MSNIRSAWIFASLAALAALAALAGCGGGGAQGGSAASPTEATIGGTLTGLPQGETLVATNGDPGNLDAIAITSNGNFTFRKKVPAGADYLVSVLGPPAGLGCSVANGTGKVGAGTTAVSNVSISCVPGVMTFITFYVGVTVSGLAQGNSVTFTNNGADTVTATDNGLFVFPKSYIAEAVYAGQAGGYAVSVQTNPKGQTCTLTNATGAVETDPQSGNLVNVLAVCK